MPDNDALLRMKADREGRRPVVVAYKGRHLAAAPTSEVVARLLAPEPITLRIPWSCLISDNALYLTKGGKRYRTKAYKEAQKRIREIAADAMQGRPPADCPLVITFRFWVPDTHRRDVHNFIAGLADSLKGVVFTDDHWLHQGGWTHAGRDIDAPRCELTLSPLSPDGPAR